MGWLTSKSCIIQSEVGEFVTTHNQLYEDKDGTIYLVPRFTQTDGYTIPLGINRTKYDIRPYTLHDIGCKSHQLIKVNINKEILIQEYFYRIKDKILCRDIPIDKLEVINIKFNKLNNIFKRSMVELDIPKSICRLYRIGVELNIGFIFTGKDNININNIYNNILYT